MPTCAPGRQKAAQGRWENTTGWKKVKKNNNNNNNSIGPTHPWINQSEVIFSPPSSYQHPTSRRSVQRSEKNEKKKNKSSWHHYPQQVLRNNARDYLSYYPLNALFAPCLLSPASASFHYLLPNPTFFLFFFLSSFPPSFPPAFSALSRFPESANFSIATNNRWWPQVGYN